MNRKNRVKILQSLATIAVFSFMWLFDIRPDGSLKAFYLNPRNINVHIASWKFEDERLFLYVEMRDVNYPGSNYTLMYRAATDVLWGSYYQAVQKQTMDVSFVRSR